MFIIHTTVVVSTILSMVTCFFSIFTSLSEAYGLAFLMPSVFMIIYGLVYGPLIRKESIRLSAATIIFFSWLRCVIMPMFGIWSGYYQNMSAYATVDSTKKAILLLTIEQIAVGITLMIYSQGKRKRIERFATDLRLVGGIPAYLIFIVGAFAFFAVFGDISSIEFIIKPVGTGSRGGDTVDTGERLVNRVLAVALLVIFLIVVEKMRQADLFEEKDWHMTVALIFALLIVSIISGERRTAQVYKAFCTIWLLTRVFPQRSKTIVITIASLSVFMISMMSIYKFFNAFLHDSYATAIGSSNIDITWISKTLESYFYGIKMVAANVGFADIADLGIKNMFFDFARSTFGLSFFLKKYMLTTSEIYNSIRYSGSQTTGYLYSSVAYGYTYLGFLLSPLITIFNILTTLKLEDWLRRSRSLEMTYIFSYMFIRFAFGVFSTPAPLISTATTYFAITGLVVLAARPFGEKTPGKYLSQNARKYSKSVGSL